MELTESMINEAAKKVYEIPFKSTAQFVSDREKLVKQMAQMANVKPEDLMKSIRKVMPTRTGEDVVETGLKAQLAISEAMKAKPMEPPASAMPRLQEAVGKVRAESAKAAPMETPFGKSLLSYTPEGKIAGKTGAALRGLGKVASRVAGPLGAALTALDLAQGLGEVQEKGAAKIAEDYKNSQLAESEDAGDKLMTEMKPITDTREYSPEERAKLKEILSKYKANAALRSER